MARLLLQQRNDNIYQGVDCLGNTTTPDYVVGGVGAEPPPTSILDNIKNNSARCFTHDCQEVYHNFYLEEQETGQRLPFRCKQWGCVTCNYNKKWSLKFKIDEIAQLYQTRYFITLTMARDVELTNAPKYFSNVMGKFQRRYQHQHHERFKFIRITELHKDGYPHFHLLTHQRLDVKWLRSNWVECGGGKIMKSIYLKPKVKGDDWKVAISKYLSSYFTKSNHILPKGYRHYTTNYKVPPKPKYEVTGLWKLMVEWDTKEGKKIINQADEFDFGCAWLIHNHKV